MPRLPKDRGPAGFTLVELTISIALMAIVSVIAYNGLNSMVKTTRGIDDRSAALEAAKGAVETITRDLRAANPIDVVTPVSLYDSELGFTVYCSNAGVGQCDAQHSKHIKYQVSNHSLLRIAGTGAGQTTTTLVGPMGFPSVAIDLRPGAIIHDSAQPVFRYYDRSNNLLSTSAVSGAPSTSFRDCAKTLEVHLVVLAVANHSAPTYDIDTKVLLRNYHLVTGC